MANYKITGSIIPAIAGLDRFATPMDIFMKLSGLVDPKEQTWPMTLGIEQEDLIAKWAAKNTGHPYVPYPSTPHPGYDWASGSPDRVVLEDGVVTRILECKFRGERLMQDYGEPGTDKVLDSDMAQVCFYLGIFPAAQEADVAIQFGNRERRLFTIKRDEELINQFYEIGQEFLENHLIPQIPPPIDGSESSRRFLNWKYPQDREPILEPTDEDILIEVMNYREGKKELKEMELFLSKCENRLKNIIGDAAGMKGEWGKLTWTRNKDSRKVDWEGICKILNPDSELVDHYTTIRPGPRVLRAYFAKED